MEAWHIALIVAGGLLFLFILFIIFIRISNRKRYYRLRDNLKKYQQENEDFDNDKRIEISDDKVLPDDRPFKKEDAIIEEYNPEEIALSKDSQQDEELPEDIGEDAEPIDDPTEKMLATRKKRDAEFESFMDDHAISRKILDKNLIDKLKNLPPEMKAIILNSVFEKFDDKN